MSSSRITRSMDRYLIIKKFTGICDDEVTKMKDDYIINDTQDLSLLEEKDADAIIGNDPQVFMKKKILLVCAYLQKGETSEQSTTMTDIIAKVKAVPASVPPQAQTQATTQQCCKYFFIKSRRRTNLPFCE